MNFLKRIVAVSGLLALTALALSARKVETSAAAPEAPKPRVIISCDPELDDLNSLIRFALFATDFDIEGIIYASSQFHWKGDGHGTKLFIPGREFDKIGLGPVESWRWAPDESFIDDVVDAYTEAYPCLSVHDPSYPTPEYMRSKVRVGNIEFDGDISKDTPGSELIKQVLLDDEGGPVFLNAWGGGSTIARALKSIQEIYEGTPQWEEIYAKVSAKAVLAFSGDQDNTLANYIKPYWPEIRSMEMSGGVGLAYNAQNRAKEENKHFYSAEYVAENFLIGPFGTLYRYWGDGKQMVEGDVYDFFGLSGYTEDQLKEMGYMVWTTLQPKGSFLAEGDTGCYLNLIANGLRGHEDPTYGGWCGGRIEYPEEVKAMSRMEQYMWARENNPLPDFTAAVFEGEAARFHWSVTPKYEDANHYPVISGSSELSGKAGETIKLNYTVSDPDKGDVLSVSWWQYVSSGKYKGKVSVDDPASAITTFTIPSDAQSGDTIHLILEATDNGTPQLNKYFRVIISVD